MKELHFGEMEEGVTYFSSDSPYKNFTEIRRKQDIIQVSFIEINNEKKINTVSYPIEIIHLVDGYQKATLEDLTLNLFKGVAIKIYQLFENGQLPDSIESKISIEP
ncbi:hypothetical protein NC797_06870 [Aquibacillus sp. 3ASR75-11]|uniref:Uncharacterized protein n=1 Tax=Terrihalobacillus insolitus TaxID=2950438 RepID=A0A9X3WVK8_9BACI|nr:hypothetical protein [Terrihalobacillus insolitus]MDC3424229.1 hypothetical protein [Terrihalobacillus insolitus]